MPANRNGHLNSPQCSATPVPQAAGLGCDLPQGGNLAPLSSSPPPGLPGLTAEQGAQLLLSSALGKGMAGGMGHNGMNGGDVGHGMGNGMGSMNAMMPQLMANLLASNAMFGGAQNGEPSPAHAAPFVGVPSPTARPAVGTGASRCAKGLVAATNFLLARLMQQSSVQLPASLVLYPSSLQPLTLLSSPHAGPPAGNKPGAPHAAPPPPRPDAANPAIASARAGPRIFVGKLGRDTSEGDVKEYFQRYGYVMDVYLPKAKDNKAVSGGAAGCMRAAWLE